MYTLFNNIVFDTIYFVVVCVDFLGTHIVNLILSLKLGVTLSPLDCFVCCRRLHLLMAYYSKEYSIFLLTLKARPFGSHECYCLFVEFLADDSS